MSVKRAVLPGGCWPSRKDLVIALGVSWLLAACSFDTQPLLDPSRSDPATGSATSSEDAATSMAAADPPSTVVDAGAATGPSSAGDAATGTASVCQPLQVMSCTAGRALTCRADGSGFDELDCGAAGCNAAANGCNECLPDRSTCDGASLTRCGADGKVLARETCALGCVGVVGGQASCRVCEPGASMCSAKDIARCAPDGMSWQMQKCADGCDPAARTCVGARLVPANIARDVCRMTSIEDLDEAGALEIDTDGACARVIQQPAGQPEICLHAYRQLRVRAGALIRVQGSRALALVATRSLRLEGRISVSARGPEAGPGSVRGPLGDGQPGIGRLADGASPGPGGDGMDWDRLPANAGGGGGGHATPGAPGGDAPGMCGQKQACAAGGLGGAMHGSEQLSPLHGGARGGANSASDDSSRGNDAGGGGGAIQLVACEELILGAHAVIDANGGGGEGGGSGSLENAVNETPGAGAGGGSGGAILIQARSLQASAGSVLVANGGGGGGGASRSNSARETLSDGENGQDGLLSSQAAAGGAPAGPSQPGGAGGALTPPMPGGMAKMRTHAAGGGGGAVGRIRIEIGPGGAILEGVVISPPASRGSVLFE